MHRFHRFYSIALFLIIAGPSSMARADWVCSQGGTRYFTQFECQSFCPGRCTEQDPASGGDRLKRGEREIVTSTPSESGQDFHSPGYVAVF